MRLPTPLYDGTAGPSFLMDFPPLVLHHRRIGNVVEIVRPEIRYCWPGRYRATDGTYWRIVTIGEREFRVQTDAPKG